MAAAKKTGGLSQAEIVEVNRAALSEKDNSTAVLRFAATNRHQLAVRIKRAAERRKKEAEVVKARRAERAKAAAEKREREAELIKARQAEKAKGTP